MELPQDPDRQGRRSHRGLRPPHRPARRFGHRRGGAGALTAGDADGLIETSEPLTRAPTLYLTCGLPGSGKTTLAKRLEQEGLALRLTADEWLHELYPDISTPEAETGPLRGRVEHLQWMTALRALELGCNVVLDWGVWAREERDHYRDGAREVGARVVLCLLDPPVDELWDRLSRRNADRPFGAFEITKAELLRWSDMFQRPTADELALYDPLEAD